MMHIFGLIFIILNKITSDFLDEIKADLFANSFVRYFIYNGEWSTCRAFSKSCLTSEACLCKYVCVHTRGSFKRWPFVCSHGKEWMKGGSAGYFGAGGDAKCKRPLYRGACNILIPGASLSQGRTWPTYLNRKCPRVGHKRWGTY